VRDGQDRLPGREAMIPESFLDRRFRAAPSFDLVSLERLSGAERTATADLLQRADVFGVLNPSHSPSPSNVPYRPPFAGLSSVTKDKRRPLRPARAQIGTTGCNIGRCESRIGRWRCGIGTDQSPIGTCQSDMRSDEYRTRRSQSGIANDR
jgi:hypothetical protein